MDRDDFDIFCKGLTATTNVIQWGNSSVWKVGGKIFAICSHWGAVERDCISFKCNDLSYQILCELPGIVPAPYLARAKWVQVQTDDALTDADLKSYIEDARETIVSKLPKKIREKLAI